MLTAIRDKVQGILAAIIVGIIAIPFALWGVNSYFEGASKVMVAEVNGEEIDEDSYRRTLDRYRGRVDPAVFDSSTFKRQIVETMIEEALLREAVEKAGYGVSNQQLSQLIRNLSFFQKDGRFDPSLYEATLGREGQSVQEFEYRMRQQKLQDQIISAFKESAIVSGKDVENFLRLKGQKRKIAIIMIEPRKFIGQVKVEDKAVGEYHEAHPEKYRVPEQVRIEYIRLAASESIKSYKPTEEEVRALYEEESGNFSTPAKRRISHILLQLSPVATAEEEKAALEKAEDVERQARTSKDFGKLAKKYSADTDSAKQDGDLGWIEPGLLPKDLEDAANRMQEGEISRPVRSEYGYHIAKVTQYKRGTTKSLQTVRKQLEKMVRDRKGEERYYDMAEQFNNLIYEQADSLQPAATALGLKITKTGWFSRRGGGGITSNPKVIAAAFSSEVREAGRNSDSLETARDTLVALRVIDHRQAKLKPLDEVRDQIRRELKRQKALKRTVDVGTAVLEAARAGRPLQRLAGQRGLKYQAPRLIGHTDTKGLDKRIIDAVYAAGRPRDKAPVFGGVDLGDKGYTVYALTRVMESKSGKASAKHKEEARQQLLIRRGRDYFDHYRTGLRKQADVKIYDDQL